LFATANPSFGGSVVFRQQANSHADCRPTETLAGTPDLPRCFAGGDVVTARKVRQRSSGMAAIDINANWLTMKPTSHGKAFCMKP
jgi:hypothetical protein